MGAYSVETKLTPEEVIERAKAFFGAGTLGLDITDDSPCCANFVGGGGHVWVTASEEEKRTTVELETREWDYQVKEFMQRIG